MFWMSFIFWTPFIKWTGSGYCVTFVFWIYAVLFIYYVKFIFWNIGVLFIYCVKFIVLNRFRFMMYYSFIPFIHFCKRQYVYCMHYFYMFFVFLLWKYFVFFLFFLCHIKIFIFFCIIFILFKIDKGLFSFYYLIKRRKKWRKRKKIF